MSIKYIAQTGDMLDEICWRYYDEGAKEYAIIQVYETNPHLCDLGVLLPAGTVFELPDLANVQKVEQVKLWD
ncbi:phage tail protein X [Sinobacterium caligoides]|uniref:Phage tail protein X n=1 Tax=Sinobacterium caligoides TaxID=933926 RepID=A0A3N2E0P9_9GAMM|nr:tail protein X [Sinobacterium caligoides]ROS05701.1 phage tail protein X [Sinobacterium caligoides]